MNQAEQNWQVQNWQYLQAAIAGTKLYLKSGQPQMMANHEGGEPPAIVRLVELFELSPFEQRILLVCAGVEFDPELGAVCGELQGSGKLNFPTFTLMMQRFPEVAYWGAILPESPLRYWRLMEVEEGPTLTQSALRIDERVLHYLAGARVIDRRLVGLTHPFVGEAVLVPSHVVILEQILQVWKQTSTIVRLYGNEIAGKAAIIIAAADKLGWQPYRLSARQLPTAPHDVRDLALLWRREEVLEGRLLVIEAEGLEGLGNGGEMAKVDALVQLLQAIGGQGAGCPVVVTTRERERGWFADLEGFGNLVVSWEVGTPTRGEQRVIWQAGLGSGNEGTIERLVGQFNLNAVGIQAVVATGAGQVDGETLWERCRVQARPQMDDLAQRIDCRAGWEDLILPEGQKQILRSVVAQVRQRSRVYDEWGFRGKSDRGLGISALFAGASGTGKTMAAEVMARELGLDLYRIDLSAVVSKYIGETEKNLRRVFDAAEVGSVVLLFDEADALFGKRSEVKDSHDRYANMEVGYLLQRMEAYRGLAILTTNLKDSLDTAFVRRLRFILKFPFPEVREREAIWRRVFPVDLPLVGVDWGKLARLNVAGGNIRNIAVNAAFLAADAGEPVGMGHLLVAAQAEYGKLERTLTDAEVRGWV